MDDGKIIDLFWERSEQAVKETDMAYGRRLYMLANKILNNREDSEESVSDTYMETWKSIPPERPRFFYAFLASICRNLSLNRLDWRMAAKRNAEVVTLTQEMEVCIPDARQDALMDSREIRRILNAFLENLPKESRLIFLRRYLYVDTVAESAARYGISESKVKTQLHRMRNDRGICHSDQGEYQVKKSTHLTSAELQFQKAFRPASFSRVEIWWTMFSLAPMIE